VDLTPEPEIYEAAARAWVADSVDAAHADWSQRDTWPAMLQDNPNLHRIVDVIYPLIHRAGREAAARDIARACEKARDEAPLTPGWFAYDHAAGLARLYRVPDCGDEYHGADGGPCAGCGFDVAEAVRSEEEV
jgi:hypothetical protein